MFFRSEIVVRRLLPCAIPVMALMASSCKEWRDDLSKKLYATPNVSLWQRDSLFASQDPAILYRVIHKGSSDYIYPIAALSKNAPFTLRMTRRGWGLLDINLMYEGKKVTPALDGLPGAPVSLLRGMWEVPSAPLDTIQGCTGATLPLALLPAGTGTELFVSNHKLPTNTQLLSPGELAEAISQVPLLVTPTVAVSASELSNYKRSIHQIPREGKTPAVFLEYHDETPQTDTSVVGKRRPRHLLIVLEQGVYGYRPTWIYSTTGLRNDRPLLRFLGILDADMDGQSELFLTYEALPGANFTMAYHQAEGTWKEYWRRSYARCDQ